MSSQPQNVKMANKIIAKLRKQANFIEHIDGNTLNNAGTFVWLVAELFLTHFSVENLRWCKFEDWLKDPTKKIDWVCYVSKAEAEFVNLNIRNFRVVFGVAEPSNK